MDFPPLQSADYRTDYRNEDESKREVFKPIGSIVEPNSSVSHPFFVKRVFAIFIFVLGVLSLCKANEMGWDGKDTWPDRMRIATLFILAVVGLGAAMFLFANTL